MCYEITGDEQEILIHYASSLRNTADEDYIAARISYKLGLTEPFLWSSLHAIEKYLKAILIFNQKNTKKFGHDVVRLLDAVRNIESLSNDFYLPEQAKLFIEYINEYGSNRYRIKTSFLDELTLFNLDLTVWHISRYCCYWNKEYDETRYRKVDFKQPVKKPHTQRSNNDFLEEVINKESAAYPYLDWNNYYYGKTEYNESSIKSTQIRFSTINSTFDIYINAIDILDNYVRCKSQTEEEKEMNRRFQQAKEILMDNPELLNSILINT